MVGRAWRQDISIIEHLSTFTSTSTSTYQNPFDFDFINMRIFSIAATIFMALSSFAAAMPSSEAALGAVDDGVALAVEVRQCRALGAKCVRNGQCCSGECHKDRCRRDD